MMRVGYGLWVVQSISTVKDCRTLKKCDEINLVYVATTGKDYSLVFLLYLILPYLVR